MLIDGRRQNSSTAMIENGMDASSAFIPPANMIERIEVLRGPASTIWGTDAVGGVVNVITKTHPDKFTGSVTVEGTMQEHRKTYGNSGGASFYYGIPMLDNELSLQLRGRYFFHEDTGVMTPAGRYATHSPTDRTQINLGGRLNWTPNRENEFFFDADYNRFKGGSMQTSSDYLKAERWFEKLVTTAGHNGEYGFGRTESYLMWNTLRQIKQGFGRYSWSTDRLGLRDKSGSFDDPLKETNMYTFASKAIMPFDYGEYGAMKLTAGVQADYEDFQDNTADDEAGRKKLDQTTLAVFAEGEYFINEQWNAIVGARFQWSDQFGSNVSPRAYLVYKPASFISFKSGVAAGYVTPNVQQVYDGYYSGSGAGDRTWGNPDLEPEESWSYELSTTIDIGRAAQITVGGFYTDFKNMISTRYLTGDEYCANGSCDTQVTNYGKVESKGIEILFKTAKFYGFSFTGGYTYTDAEVKEGDDKGKSPNEIPKHSLQLRVDYAYNNFGAYLKSTSKFKIPCTDTRAGVYVGDEYRDYTVVDLGLNYRFFKKHLIAFAINNILDTDYTDWVGYSSTYSNRFNQYLEGRNYWLSYTYEF